MNKSTELLGLLRSRAINLSDYRMSAYFSKPAIFMSNERSESSCTGLDEFFFSKKSYNLFRLKFTLRGLTFSFPFS